MLNFILKQRIQLFFLFLFINACVPSAVIRYYPKAIEKSLSRKIIELESIQSETQLVDNKKLDLIKYKVQYAYGYLLEQADRVSDDDYTLATEYQDSAKIVFLNAINLSKALLSNRHSNFKIWIKDPNMSNISFTKDDVPFLYWLAASYGGIISASRAHPKWVVHLPKIGMLLDKAIQINPSWNQGALYTAMISYTVSRPDPPENIRQEARQYFELAIKASNDQDASPYIAFAENICIKEQDKADFIKLTNHVLAMDVNQNSDLRLSNILSQDRARWLQSKVEDYFYE